METHSSLKEVEREWLGVDTPDATADNEKIHEAGRSGLPTNEDVDEMAHERMLTGVLDAGWKNIPFYRDLISGRSGTVDRPQRLEDWPTWSVSDLRGELAAHPPFGRLYDQRYLDPGPLYVHSSTGTTGDPRFIPLLPGDIPSLSEVYRSFFVQMGVRPDDICAMTLAYGLPQGGWSLTRGARAVGATVIPISTGRVTAPEKALRVIGELSVSVLLGTPSYLLHMARIAEKNGVDVGSGSVRLILLSGERAPLEVRRELEERWGAKTRVWYANTDVGWLAVECDASGDLFGELGMHVPVEYAHLEILDSDGAACADGDEGEVVVTTAVRPSSPRIRFRTGDRAAQDRRPCACGRTSPRLLPISGRADDSIRYHGVTVWPNAIEAILRDCFGRLPEYFLEVGLNSLTQREDLILSIELEAGDNPSAMEQNLKAVLKAALGVRIEVVTVAPGSLTEKTGVDSGKTRRSNR